MSLALKLLGEFEVRDEHGKALSLPTRKTRALLGYLAVNADRPQPRERLMTLLWSDRGERQARQSLNQALLSIRKLGDSDGTALLDSDGERVTLRSDAVTSDVQRLRSLANDDPVEAAALYDGPFLDGLSIPDPTFEDWLLATRSELHTLACDTLETASETSKDTKSALSCAKRLVTLDPLREDAHRRLMGLLHESGDRAAALRQYQTCAETLQRELQVEPDAATKALFEEIRRNAGSEAKTVEAPTKPRAYSSSDRPSIAVLPFDVIGNDPQANDLGDGLTEDLITALAKVPELLVIARHSTSTYKGKAVKVQEVAEALGVRYVLEGSIQKYGNRMRITPQLIDAESGHHLWAERYDRPMEDVFALQDEIVRRVLIELQVKLTAGDSARIASRGTNNLKAWLLRVEGYAETAKYTREGMVRARALLEEANRADPNWARPVAGIALTHEREALRGWSASREESIRLGIEHAERAITMDSQDPLGYQVLGNLRILHGDYESAIVLGEKAVSIAPNDVLALGGFGGKLVLVGEAERAIAVFERAVRVCPVLPRWPQHRYGLALLIAGHIKRAITVLEDLVQREHDFLLSHALLAAVYVEAGRLDAATAATKTLLEQDPTFTISDYLMALPFQDEQRIEWLRTLLVKAGLLE